MKKVFGFMKKHAPVIASLCLSGTLALTAVWVRDALTEDKQTKAEPGEKSEYIVRTEKNAYRPPSDGEILTPFSMEVPVFNTTLSVYEAHGGEDYFCPDGAVFCAAEGQVLEILTDDRYGLTVRVLHEDGAETVYASLSETFVKAGQKVSSGQRIALSGDSARCERELGKHVHFEYRINSESVRCPFASDAES